jgi:hypothetical protein
MHIIAARPLEGDIAWLGELLPGRVMGGGIVAVINDALVGGT